MPKGEEGGEERVPVVLGIENNRARKGDVV
jgi:hypothetical protein